MVFFSFLFVCLGVLAYIFDIFKAAVNGYMGLLNFQIYKVKRKLFKAKFSKYHKEHFNFLF